MNRNCQVFTPTNYVIEILDFAGYDSDLAGKRILENSCGNGNVLVQVVKRYIEDCKNKGMSRTKIRNGLQNDIYAMDIDPIQVNVCIEQMNDIVSSENILPVKWNIFTQDFLKWASPLQFDYIVGNPPYITYSELTNEEQERLKKDFKTCNEGKFDYCYAFVEKSYDLLANNGKLSYLIPASVFKTRFGQAIRDYVCDDVVSIREYREKALFDEVLVKPAIMMVEKGCNGHTFRYDTGKGKTSLDLPKSLLVGKWIFSEEKKTNGKRFGDYFRVSHSVATLRNDIFVLSSEDISEKNGEYCYQGVKLENDIIYRGASPKTERYKRKEYIIFPYQNSNGVITHFSPEEFERRYPQIANYLMNHKDELDKRKSDDKAQWFEYGRSQALEYVCKRKLLLSTVITGVVMIYELDENTIPYSGMIVTKKGINEECSLEQAKKILMSRDFFNYAKMIGIPINGNSVRITSKDIENYYYEEE